MGISTVFCAALVLGQVTEPDPGQPLEMSGVVFGISLSSIVAALVVAGGLLLVSAIGPKVAFGLVKRLVRRLRRSV